MLFCLAERLAGCSCQYSLVKENSSKNTNKSDSCLNLQSAWNTHSSRYVTARAQLVKDSSTVELCGASHRISCSRNQREIPGVFKTWQKEDKINMFLFFFHVLQKKFVPKILNSWNLILI